jgi:membrane protease YdiL (CAAX protease family)
VTILSALVLLAGSAGVTWLQITTPRLDRVASPERALTLMVGRMMDLEEAVTQAPGWEQKLYDLTSGGRDYELAQAVEWFEELVHASPDHLVPLRLAVLHAEAGHIDRLWTTVTVWETRPEPFASFARMLRSGYLSPTLDPTIERTFQAELAETLPAGWFYDRLAINLAKRAGDQTLLGATQQAIVARGQPLLWSSRVFALLEFGGIALGCAVLVAEWVRRRRRPDASSLIQVALVPFPPPWSGYSGMAVLLRGGALGMVLIGIFLFVGTDDPLIRLAAIPVTNVPILWLARVYLLQPSGRGLREGLGLIPSPGGWRRLGPAALAVLAVGLAGEWGIDRLAVSFNQASHWTEWFDPDLVWGPLPIVAISLLEYVVLAPLFEEIVFRGLLFATLRRRFGWGSSALISASIFAVAHGYGLLGFASVLWSGIVWAWAYEKTGSVLPGMAGHALNNLLVCLTLMALLRS